MAVTTVSMHYSRVSFNGILYSKQQFSIREERNVNDVISLTDDWPRGQPSSERGQH